MAEANEVDHLLDQLLKGKSPEEILGRDGVLKASRSASSNARSRVN
jgi:hypothetical protein